MKQLLITIFTLASVASFWQFIKGKYRLSPLPLMLSVWLIAIAISQLHLSNLETVWPAKFWYLLFVSLVSFVLGFFAVSIPIARSFAPKQSDDKIATAPLVPRDGTRRLRYIIYGLFGLSLVALYLFYNKAGNFPLFANDPDAFRFMADDEVPGLINYLAQLARIFVPLSFFLIFYEGFNWPFRKKTQQRLPRPGADKIDPGQAGRRKHWDLVLICLIGVCSLIFFTSRTQIFFIDLWVMALYLLQRRPNLKQALKFYPIFLLISVLVLAIIPIYRQSRSYGNGYLAGITGIPQTNNKLEQVLLPIYVGVSFNQQALLHAENYYQTHQLQYGRVSLDPFTNLLGKVIKPLNSLKSNYDLGAIFYSWWNTGTYLFPFVQDFGTAAFYVIPFLIAGILTLLWHYWKTSPNFLSINLYAYAMFFIVMTVYLSFTVRAEMYLDLMLLVLINYVTPYVSPKNES